MHSKNKNEKTIKLKFSTPEPNVLFLRKLIPTKYDVSSHQNSKVIKIRRNFHFSMEIMDEMRELIVVYEVVYLLKCLDNVPNDLSAIEVFANIYLKIINLLVDETNEKLCTLNHLQMTHYIKNALNLFHLKLLENKSWKIFTIKFKNKQ